MILFLDFDGVLHPAAPTTEAELFCRRSLLWRLLAEQPAIDVVLSTSWRNTHTVAELIGFATAGGGERFADRFVGGTPMRVRNPEPAIAQEYMRETEIRLWLAGNGEQGRNWIALDDFAPYFSPDCPCLVLVMDPDVGLQDDDLMRFRAACAGLAAAGVLNEIKRNDPFS